MSENPYETLGVDRSASKDEIQKAYRKRAKSEHPDAGGSAERFGALTRAHRILTDDAKRAQFDETGEIDDRPDTLDAHALELIHSIFEDILSKPNVTKMAVADVMRDVIEANRAHHIKAAAAAEREKSRLWRVHERLRPSEGRRDPLGPMLMAKIQGIDANIAAGKKMLTVVDRASEMMTGYDFEREVEQPTTATVKVGDGPSTDWMFTWVNK
jgi:curved DNA-binding protein CbpA